ncbi:hypothetical protein BDV3_003624 [Batrachochytrium dendrobatidis]|uniref:Metallo-beta-lactamase domain-containing protein n=1 Tax=Batrachochytrium dendrobatidis (strain JEL423) TaxID=403673 RepID=A0A177WER1_BATDL|nr:hypothetical protein QVD99_003902 [Batrachochytrium dendrobatidis]OAJ38030.1 hypothetical protein BDEG_21999 [Batrachochytrium dendrobatidis JEL423]
MLLSKFVVDSLTRNVARLTVPAYGPYSSQPSNVYLVGSGSDRLLIDAGNGHPGLAGALEAHLQIQKARLSAILLTHSHSGHMGGISDIMSLYSSQPPIIHKIKLDGFDSDALTISMRNIQSKECISTLDKSVQISAICTPGHTADHASFWLASEGILFSGDAIENRSTVVMDNAHAVFQDLTSYSRSLSHIQRLAPSLIFPSHGDVVQNPFNHIENAIDRQSRISNQIEHIVRSAPGEAAITTKDIITAFSASYRNGLDMSSSNLTKFATDEFCIAGTIRQHILALECRGILKRQPTIFDPTKRTKNGMDPTKIKGPGGLTMDRIFGHVQASRRMDWEADKSNRNKTTDYMHDRIQNRVSTHPIHANVDLSYDVFWKCK